jgi:hypothetical protein
MYPTSQDNGSKGWRAGNIIPPSLLKTARFFDLSQVFDDLVDLFTVPCTENSETVIRRFDTRRPVLAAGKVDIVNHMWVLSPDRNQRTPFFKVSCPGLQDCEVTFRLKVKSNFLDGWVFPEMRCEYLDGEEETVRDADQVLRRTSDWTVRELSFRVYGGEAPIFYKLNIISSGKGCIFVKDVELVKKKLIY